MTARRPPSRSDTLLIIAASGAILEREPEKMQVARDALHSLRARMVLDGADPAALSLLCDNIRWLDVHLRRRSQAPLKLVCNDIKQVK